MKNTIVSLLVLWLAVSVTGCTKSTSPPSSFSWVYNLGNETVAMEHKAYIATSTSPAVIIASKNAAAGSPEIIITLSSLNKGVYSIADRSPTGLQYSEQNSATLFANHGTINITDASNNLISGNFSVFADDQFGISRSITGTFVKTVVQP